MTENPSAFQFRGRFGDLSQPRKRSALVGWGVAAAVIAGTGSLALLNNLRRRKAERENPPVGKSITIDGVKLHYLDEGQGPIVVLLHGNGTTLVDWTASGVVRKLSARHRVIAFDRPGFGYSERPRTRLWTPASQANVIALALRSIGADHVTVVGHSFGALVAMALALGHRDMVAAAALLGGYYFPSVRGDVLYLAPPAIPLLGDVMRYTVSPLLGAAMRGAVEARLFDPKPVPPSWRDDFPFDMTLRPGQIRAEAAEAAMMIPAAASLASRHAKLDLPLLIIAGDGDQVSNPSEQAQRLADSVRGSELLMLEGVGHMVHHSATSEVSDAIEALVAKGQARTSTESVEAELPVTIAAPVT
jgi:pimeloyl-ACP methyl ester carboxylesterase